MRLVFVAPGIMEFLIEMQDDVWPKRLGGARQMPHFAAARGERGGAEVGETPLALGRGARAPAPKSERERERK